MDEEFLEGERSKNIEWKQHALDELSQGEWRKNGQAAWILFLIVQFTMGDGFAWGGWDPPELYNWLVFFAMLIGIFSTGYWAGHSFDLDILNRTVYGETPRITTWRHWLSWGAASAYLVFAVLNPSFFFPA